jgi:hypothetical protein
MIINKIGSDPTVQAVLQRRPDLSSLGPELLVEIVEAYLPTSPEHMSARLLAVHSTVQGSGEWCETYRLRLLFLLKCLNRSDGSDWTDGTLKQLLFVGVLRGPYHEKLQRTFDHFTKEEGMKTLHGIKFATCSSLEVAQCIDTVLHEVRTKTFERGTLKAGKDIALVRLVGPDIKYEPSSGRANLTTSRTPVPAPVPAPIPTPVPIVAAGTALQATLPPLAPTPAPTGTIDTTSERAMVTAMEPFIANGC